MKNEKRKWEKYQEKCPWTRKNEAVCWSVQEKAVPLRSVLKERPADMAQLVEQRIRNAWVRGSSPRSGS